MKVTRAYIIKIKKRENAWHNISTRSIMAVVNIRENTGRKEQGEKSLFTRMNTSSPGVQLNTFLFSSVLSVWIYD